MQLIEKYLTAGKDAISQDDIVTAESCFQHADHYTRLYNLANAYENSRKEEMLKQQQMRNEAEEQDGNENNPANAVDAEDTPTEKDGDADEIETEVQKPIMLAASESPKEKDKIADLPFLNTAISLPESDSKEENPKRKRVTLKNRKRAETPAANDTETASITPSDATA